MPRLDTVSFFNTIHMNINNFFFLFSLLVNTILPRLQQQLAIRSRSGAGASPRTEETTKLEIFKNLFQLKV